MIQMLRQILKKIIKGQKGQALPIVLILLVIGGLLIVPTLNYASTSLKGHQVVESNTLEFYAADSGIEDALHWIIHGKESGGAWAQDAENHWTRATYDLNGRSVDVTVEEIAPEAITEAQRQTFDLKEGDTVYEITSTATTDSGSSTTIIECYVVRTTALADEESYTPYGGGGNIEGGNVTVEADGTVNGNIEGGNVYGGGNLTANNKIETGAIVYVEGNLTVNNNIETGAIVYVEGNLTVNKIETGAKVCVLEGNLTVNEIEGSETSVYVAGDLILHGSIEDATVCVGGEFIVDGNVESGNIYAEGYLNFGNCPDFCGQCPLLEEVLKILTFGM